MIHDIMQLILMETIISSPYLALRAETFKNVLDFWKFNDN